jgi:hypothetical protein
MVGWRVLLVACCVTLLCVGEPAGAVRPLGSGGPFLYLHHNVAAPEVIALQMAGNGTLAPVPGSPFAVSGGGETIATNVQSIAFLPDRDLLFVPTASRCCAWRATAPSPKLPARPSAGPSRFWR